VKRGNSNDNGFITVTASYTTGWDPTATDAKDGKKNSDFSANPGLFERVGLHFSPLLLSCWR